jgi:hypothetical protein
MHAAPLSRAAAALAALAALSASARAASISRQENLRVEIDVAAPPPPPPTVPFAFDAGFGSNMVLQRGPGSSAVYGFLPPGATGAVVTLTNTGTGTVVANLTASLNATAQAFGPGFGARPCPKAVCPPYDMNTFTPFNHTISTWKALLPPQPAGGDFSVSVACIGCAAGTQPLSIVNVTFGDVWFCSGQSNMWLTVQHTFTRNETAGNISNYANIRLMAGSSGNVPYAHWPPAYGITGGSNEWLSAEQAVPAGCIETQTCPLFAMGGSCWYTMQSLVDQGLTDVPLGILNTAIGGQRIEEYMVNTTFAACTNLSGSNIPWWDGQLYGQQTLPFVDMVREGGRGDKGRGGGRRRIDARLRTLTYR